MKTSNRKHYKIIQTLKHASKRARMMAGFAYNKIIKLRSIRKYSVAQKGLSSMKSSRLPCKLLEYFQA